MNSIATSLIDRGVQCWGCEMFDRLFQVVSGAAGTAYGYLSRIFLIVFCTLFAIYVVNAIWQNMKSKNPDPLYQKSIQRVFINSVVALGLLGMGVALPRFITTVTVEPVTEIATVYTQTLVNQTDESVAQRVTYEPMKMDDNGMFRPEMRDKIIMLMKTTITQFQSYMKLGLAVIDRAFEWSALLGIGSFIKHAILFIIGLYITIGFFKLFFRYCCYFIDIIIAMMFFAFFFPLSLVMMAFKDAGDVPGWIAGLGKTVGVSQLKKMINAIITLGAAVITYTVIMVIIAKFMSAPGASNVDLMNAITSGNVFADDLNTENLAAMSLMGCVAFVYVLNFISGEIPKISKMILDAFGVDTEKKFGDQLADDIMKLTSTVWDTTKQVGKIIVSGGEDGKDDKKDDK